MTLTNQEFSTYYNTLEFIIDSAGVVINDEVSDVATYNIVQGKLNIENAIIDDVEYELTDKQKDIIYLAILELVDQFKNDSDSAFTDEDYTHFTNLIYR